MQDILLRVVSNIQNNTHCLKFLLLQFCNFILFTWVFSGVELRWTVSHECHIRKKDTSFEVFVRWSKTFRNPQPQIIPVTFENRQSATNFMQLSKVRKLAEFCSCLKLSIYVLQ